MGACLRWRLSQPCCGVLVWLLVLEAVTRQQFTSLGVEPHGGQHRDDGGFRRRVIRQTYMVCNAPIGQPGNVACALVADEDPLGSACQVEVLNVILAGPIAA